MHSAATQSALHFHVTQILIENPRQHLTTQPVGNIQHRFLSRHFAPTRHIVPFSVLGWDILILLKKIACHRETNPPLSPPFWRYAYACAVVFMTRILSFETDYPRVSRNPTRWSRGTKTLGTRLLSVIIHTFTSGSFIRCECRTLAATTYFPEMIFPPTEATNPDTT